VMMTKKPLIMMCIKTGYERDQEGKVAATW
jgi:hypothetical protein